MSTKQRDIEAYVKTSDISWVIMLLSSAVGELRIEAPPSEDVQIYKHKDVSVVLQPSEEGFLSVWVRGATPWSSSPALGRYLARSLHCVVRCDPEAEYPEVSPYSNVFLQIEGDRESLVTWG